MPKAKAHKWTFRARFRRRAFGWRSQPAIKRIKEAVSEIKKVARKHPALVTLSSVRRDWEGVPAAAATSESRLA
jgi:hypothetical protein